MLINKIPNWLLAWPRPFKRAVAVAVDVCLCLFSLWLSMSLRFERVLSPADLPLHMVVLSVGLAIPLFMHFGLYRAIFRYAGVNAIFAMARAAGLYGVMFSFVYSVITWPGVPRAVGVMQPLLLLLLVGLSRSAVRYWLGGMYREMIAGKGAAQVLIYGAGSAGRQLAAGLSASKDMSVVGYLDDDDRLHGQVLNGIRIHGVGDIPKLISGKGVSLVLLAIPSAGRERRNEILALLGAHHLSVRTLPPLYVLVEGRVKESDLKELDLEDLLGRDPVAPNPLMMAKTITGKTVMVTGAGGSIGSELCRQILRCGPRKLLLVELSEFSLYAIHQELERFVVEELAGDMDVIPLLANVRDPVRMGEILSTWKPETVYHAAAYKHVPLVEHNPAEGIRNNVFGTHTVASQSAMHGVIDFVLVSTDKAVRPTNIMGASKRLAEMVLQANAENVKRMGGQTRFSMVRFGNVLGSSGSVVPLFRQQIKSGGPITLTHAEVTRYFMTIPEAAQLVIQAGAMATGGDVYVLDMGQPVKIGDLARRMVVLSGLTVKDEEHPSGDIEIQVKGMRPGEKLYEELLIGDNPLPTHHPRIMKAHEDFLRWDELHDKLQTLSLALDVNDVPTLRRVLKDLVPGYRPEGDVVDWVWVESKKAAAL
ncbi:MAG: polysaccharide biosynthesis protein [Limnohabitans sp.]